MSNLEEKTYYVLTHDGEPVLYGNNIRLHPCKEDIKAAEYEAIEAVHLVRVEKAENR